MSQQITSREHYRQTCNASPANWAKSKEPIKDSS